MENPILALTLFLRIRNRYLPLNPHCRERVNGFLLRDGVGMSRKRLCDRELEEPPSMVCINMQYNGPRC